MFSCGQKFWEWHKFWLSQSLVLQCFRSFWSKVWGVSWPWNQSSPSHLVVTLASRQGVSSWWKKALIVTKLFLGGWKILLLEGVLYHSLFMSVFSGTILSESTTLAEKQPHIWSQDTLLLTWHRIDGSTHRFISGQAVFRIQDSLEKMNLPQSSVVQSLCLLHQSVTHVFPGEKWLLCCPSWPQASLQNLHPAVYADAHTSAYYIREQALHWLCFDLAAESTLEALAGLSWAPWRPTIEPLSLKLLIIL